MPPQDQTNFNTQMPPPEKKKSGLIKILVSITVLLVGGGTYLMWDKYKLENEWKTYPIDTTPGYPYGTDGDQNPTSPTSDSSSKDIGDKDVKIISPQNNQEFSAGDVVTVNFKVGKGVTSVTALYGAVGGSSSPEQKEIQTPNGGTYSFTYPVPSNFVGQVEFNIFSSDTTVFAHSSVTVKIKTSLAPASFVFDQSVNENPHNTASQIGLWYMPNPEARSSVGIKVKYSDGSIKEIVSKDVKYEIQDKNIVEIYPGNFSNLEFYGKNIGSTNVTFSYKGINKTMKILVRDIYNDY